MLRIYLVVFFIFINPQRNRDHPVYKALKCLAGRLGLGLEKIFFKAKTMGMSRPYMKVRFVIE